MIISLQTQQLENQNEIKMQQRPTCLKELLEEFEQVFHMLKGLPPSRGGEHAIILKEEFL